MDRPQTSLSASLLLFALFAACGQDKPLATASNDAGADIAQRTRSARALPVGILQRQAAEAGRADREIVS